jgi:non-canonical purine NTP pyrophosphatase (RdgB/HAM1 family)
MTGPLDQPIVLASGNPKKLAEMREILGAIGLEIVGLNDLGLDLTEPEETGTNFAENARIKAIGYAEQTGRACLADDSGLVVDALDGEPGVYSARYSADEHPGDLPRADRDRLNNKKLLRRLADTPLKDRTARFVCAMCLATPKPGGGGVPPPTTATPRPTLIKRKSGNLPHWRYEGSTYFVTFRVLEGELTPDERQLVADACLHIHNQQRAVLHIATIMPDHVHMLLRPQEGHDLSKLLHSLKSFTAHQINTERGASGKLWQRESYDRIMRSANEIAEKYKYIEQNAVRRRLVDRPGDYQWTVIGDDDGRRDAAPTGEASATITPPQILAETQGTFEGVIGLPGDVPRGANGFGYDPLFLVTPDLARSSAELTPGEKHALSHRGHAARAIAEKLRALKP